ncbi:MAG: transglycosylase SLT domain-containing protein [Desulfobacterales bacterium]|nr:transglycosylase SLT domain-containing protein [Desulfobacterales bacterium]
MRGTEYIKEFMLISVGRPGINIRLSKFGTFIFAVLLIILIFIVANIVIKEVSQRNIEIEKHRKTIQNLKDDIKKKDEELKELNEFKELMDAIKKLSRSMLNKKDQQDLAMIIYGESQKYKYDWRMILAIIMTESNFKAKLVVSNNYYGLMQLKDSTAKAFGSKLGMKIKKNYELYSIKKNVLIGAFYLFLQIIDFKDIKRGIIAYNTGPTRAKKNKKVSSDYLSKVLNNYRYLQENYNVAFDDKEISDEASNPG